MAKDFHHLNTSLLSLASPPVLSNLAHATWSCQSWVNTNLSLLFSWYCQHFPEIVVHQANKTITVVVQTPAKHIWKVRRKRTTWTAWLWNYSQTIAFLKFWNGFRTKLAPAELLGLSWSIASQQILPGNFLNCRCLSDAYGSTWTTCCAQTNCWHKLWLDVHCSHP